MPTLNSWSASANLPIGFVGNHIALRDDNNGLCYNVQVVSGALVGINMARTTDGGATWTTVNSNGHFYLTGLDAVQGKFISYGRRSRSNTTLAEFGYSESTDGINWTDVQASVVFYALDVLDATARGYSSGPAGSSDAVGIYKTVNSQCPTSNGALPCSLSIGTAMPVRQPVLAVYPTPGASGLFAVSLGADLKAGAQLRVLDTSGRVVYSQELHSSASGLSLDLTRQAPGIYQLELRTPTGIARQKLVLE